jgi:hypothetical protein
VANGGQRLGAKEAKLIGPWHVSSTDSTHTLTFERDHTWTSSMWGGGERFIDGSGTWRLENNEIVREIKWSAYERLRKLYPNAQKPPRFVRETIEYLGATTLALKDGVTYTRGK